MKLKKSISIRTVAYVGGFIISTLTIPLVSALKSWRKVSIVDDLKNGITRISK